MVDFVPLLLMAIGVVSLVKPEWTMAIHRRQKAAGTTGRPDDVEPSRFWYVLNYLSGVCFVLFGLFFTVRSL